METVNPCLTIHLKTASSDTIINTCRVTDTVATLRENVIRELSAQGKHVRLICAGKLLDVDNNPLSKYGIADGSYVHAVITGASPSAPAYQRPPPMGPSLASFEHRGFDRLTQIGLTIDETAALRSSFNPHVDDFIRISQSQRREGEDDVAFRYRMEQEWMSSQDATSEFYLNLPSDRRVLRRLQGDPGSGASPANFSFSRLGRVDRTFAEPLSAATVSPGTMNDFIWGLAMGFGLGVLMLFCVWDRNISHKQKLGILTGVFLHMLGGVLQQSYGREQAHDGRMEQSLMAQTPTEIVFEENK